MAAPRKWTPDQVADVVLRTVAGESTRAIAALYGRSPSTVSRLVLAPDIAAIVAEQRATEKRRAGDRERQSRKTERDHRASVGAVQTPHSARRDGKTIAEQKHASDAGDGHILGWARAGHDGSFSYTKASGGSLEHESRDQWLVRRAREREEALDLPSADNATVQTPTALRSYDPYDLEDIARVVALVEEEFPGIDPNDLRATLASVAPGRTFTLDAEVQAA